ncbi:MAG: hypothetical protein AAGF76_14930 [Pseudomonadota bacterium]
MNWKCKILAVFACGLAWPTGAAGDQDGRLEFDQFYKILEADSYSYVVDAARQAIKDSNFKYSIVSEDEELTLRDCQTGNAIYGAALDFLYFDAEYNMGQLPPLFENGEQRVRELLLTRCPAELPREQMIWLYSFFSETAQISAGDGGPIYEKASKIVSENLK